MIRKVFIEFDQLSKILEKVKEGFKKKVSNDEEMKKMLHDIFFDIDNILIAYEEKYKREMLESDYKKELDKQNEKEIKKQIKDNIFFTRADKLK